MINADKPHLWKSDIASSVALYNEWFLNAAPMAYRETRAGVIKDVERVFVQTNDLFNITPAELRRAPDILATLRMCTAPPIARDRLVGLANSTKPLVGSLEEGRFPVRMTEAELERHLASICKVLTELLDLELFDWLASGSRPTSEQRQLAAVVVSDRRCGAVSDPVIRNAQEQRQLALIESWLVARGYRKQPHPSKQPLDTMTPGTFSLRQVVVVGGDSPVKVPIDVVVQPHNPSSSGYPILIEAKSAGDFTNTNKRRKEEAAKIRQLREQYGPDIGMLLFLCGYFDSGYLGYEAAEGLDWVWEHRIDDLAKAGL